MFKNLLDKTIEKAVTAAIKANSEKALKTFQDLLDKGRELESLQKEILRTRDELASVRQQKKLEQEEIEHQFKLKQEREKLSTERQRVTLEGEFQKKELKLQTEYFAKLEGKIDKYSKDIKEVYSMISKKLPDVNVKMKGEL